MSISRRTLWIGVAVAAMALPSLAVAQRSGSRTAVQPESSPLRTVAIAYKEFPASDAVFKSLWKLDPKRIDVPGYPPKAYVGYVREASGSLLTLTMISAPEECGPNICTEKVFRDGKLLGEFPVCSAPADHRITADGKSLLFCDSTVPIPP